jgi:tetratricopeptide (TPR) repeat protein
MKKTNKDSTGLAGQTNGKILIIKYLYPNRFHKRFALRAPLHVFFLKSALGLLLCLAALAQGFGQSVHQSLKKGDRQYLRDNYKQAEKEYRTAADLELGNPKALYNLGNALYQQGKWEDAAERFDKAAQYSSNKADLANTLHNLGNALLKQNKFKEAVDAFENSLRLHPGDPATKTNLQMAKKKLQKEEQEKQQKEQQQQNQQQQKEQQDQQQQNQQQNQNQPNEQQNQQNQPQPNNSGQPQQPDKQSQQPETGKMRKEDAQRILETAVEPDDQKNAKKYRSAQPNKRKKGNKQDW